MIVFIVFIFAARPIASVFNDHEGVIGNIVLYLRWVSYSYGFLGVIMLSGASMNAMNRPLPAAALTICRMLVLYIPAALLGQHFFGIKGIFSAAAMANIGTGILAYFWFNHLLKRKSGFNNE